MSREKDVVDGMLDRASKVVALPRDSGGTDPPLREMPKPDLATASLEVIRFVVALLLPRGFVSLLGGHGDAGKTLLALVVAAHVACGRRFADLTCITGRVLFVSLEDNAELVWWRLRRIAEAFGLDFATITRNITVLDAPDVDDTALAFEHASNGTRNLVFTTAFEQVRAYAAGQDLIVIDNGSDAFDADENSRRLVRRFIRALQRIAREHDAAMWLLAHIDKAGARYGTAGESYAGSTAWHNTVRSRLALVEGEAGLELRQEKLNLAKKLEHPIVLERNEHGVPMPLSRADRERAGSADWRAVLEAIRGAEAAGLSVPTATSGSKPVTQFLATRPEIPDELADSPDRIRAALIRLERDGSIARELYRDPDQRKKRERFTCAK